MRQTIEKWSVNKWLELELELEISKTNYISNDLLTLYISMVWRIDSEERMVFFGGHPVKYWPPTIVCAVCDCVYCFVWYLL